MTLPSLEFQKKIPKWHKQGITNSIDGRKGFNKINVSWMEKKEKMHSDIINTISKYKCANEKADPLLQPVIEQHIKELRDILKNF